MALGIIFLAIGVAVAAAVFGSVAFSVMNDSLDAGPSALEKECQGIADRGYRIHSLYPTSDPDELPAAEREEILELDRLWMERCVQALPHEAILDIAANVERDRSYGE